MTPRPTAAMVLAAGLGTRMRPLTQHTPKPLLPLGGRSLLDHALDRLAAVGVQKVAINAHWQAARLRAYVHARQAAFAVPELALLAEDTLLDTGGGVAAALPVLGAAPFYVLNGDAFWVDGPRPALARLADAWHDDIDGVLLVHRTFQVSGDVGFGDFFVGKWGELTRRAERQVAPYLYAGVQLIRPAMLAGLQAGPFSMNLAWDRAMAAGRLRAVVHDGLWFHLSTPADLRDAEYVLAARLTGDTR
jgi:MurNAc alpha-1-phosphate uridylyltransferase